MALVRRRRAGGPVRSGRVLLVEEDAAELDRVAGALREAGLRVVALNRPDALVPLARAFRPEVVVLGVRGPEAAAARIGRRLHRKFRGTVPVLYLGDPEDRALREVCFGVGAGMELFAPQAMEELVRRIRALLAFRSAISTADRVEFEARAPTLHDEVTGLYNRRFLLELVGAEARRAERYGGQFAVMIAELADFLALRDRFGEESCNRLMVYCSVLLKQSLREADVIARVGRYHFGVLLPGMPQELLPRMIDRLGRRLSLARFQLEGRAVRAEMTFGAASFPDVVGTAPQIFARAIQELDRARDERRAGPPRAAV